jgi:hypothetical protein
MIILKMTNDIAQPTLTQSNPGYHTHYLFPLPPPVPSGQDLRIVLVLNAVRREQNRHIS